MSKDYIIAVDNNGQPYITHSNGPRGHSHSTHRYVAKVKVGNGPRDYRYFYSQTEYQKWLTDQHRQQLSARDQMNKRLSENPRKIKELQKERDRLQRAADKAYKNGQYTLQRKVYSKIQNIDKDINKLWEESFGKDSSVNTKYINWDV